MQVAADRTDASTAIQTDFRNFCVFGTQPIYLADHIFVARRRGEDVEALNWAGDVAGLLVRLAQLKEKSARADGAGLSIIAIQEAGLDGFWIHRVLQSEGIESHVVDAASILTSRRRRRAKTDGIDGETLVRTLLATNAGSRGCARWSRRRHPKRKTAAGSAGSARRSLASEWNTSTGSRGCSSPKASLIMSR